MSYDGLYYYLVPIYYTYLYYYTGAKIAIFVNKNKQMAKKSS